ncbi:DODA-type extradiol aromatic ring-opening family dioxygenase [Thiomicrorhabdus indica]|uniref:DODA-type extradiol aromatic ring-opening family dioxygenase n=1 Tax=Thiomicrorhabdus indica TaxID=2267253 RepID=UPI00102D7C23|nr:class III extradiol ring-cleavage dioxygenase [Thiomicrorhabdus indica]
MTEKTTRPVKRQPVLFIPHGAGPCFFMDWNPPHIWYGMADFLRNIANTLTEKPKAILIVSGHWQSADFRITASSNMELIYDYFGFPAHTYELTYPASGDPLLAKKVKNCLNQAGIKNELYNQRGFDHGVFIPLKLMFPDAEIPVVQLSLKNDLDPSAHFEAGSALSKLRDEGVLIIGSGMSFHNMAGYGDDRFSRPSELFDDWLTQTLNSPELQRQDALKNWTQAPHARDCHPLHAEEHLLPLMVVAGAAGQDTGKKIFSEQILKTQLSAFQFG